MIKKLNYDIINKYPKCEKSLYDDGEEIIQELEVDVKRDQMELF